VNGEVGLDRIEQAVLPLEQGGKTAGGDHPDRPTDLCLHPAQQQAGYARVRAALGPADALQRNADWILATVQRL